jgi:flagellar motor switch protein FliG
VRTAAEILNFVGTAHETAIIDNVREYDPDLAQKIIDEMFVFENLIDVDDRGIQLLLREVQSESLVLALKGANEAMREKIFKNMSQRAAEMLREDLESKGRCAVRSRARAEGNPQDRPPPGRRGPDPARRQGRGRVRLSRA